MTHGSLQARSTARKVLEILLAIIVPPVAVFLHRGCGIELAISILLWILGIIPAIIYALLIVL
ncbi:plasma membrane proteolipid Pmp3 [Dimargaris cristalligena]|nr:plasma membrane proteolipid Pmp3 [Dimargaris cristalligena]